MTVRWSLALIPVLAVSTTVADDRPLDDERLFDEARLVKIDIEMPEKDWLALCSQTRDFAEALGHDLPPRPFTYFKGDVVIDGVRLEAVGVRKKGFLGSLDDERPSLKIKFDEYEEKRFLAGVDRLTLNNNKQDPSQSYQTLAYRLFRRAGVPAPRCNLARVTVNGADLGIYSNVESIRLPLLQRHFGDGSGRLYEGTLADFFPERLERFEAKGRAREEPRTALERVTGVLAKEGDLAVEQLESAVDIDAFLRFWAVESLISFWDGYTNNQNNFFVYENPKDSRLHWIPWGVDAAFSPPPFLPFLPHSPPSVQAHSVLANRLYHDDRMRERYRKALLNVLETVWQEEHLMAEIDVIQKLAADHLHRHQRDFESRLQKVRWFINGRRADVLADLEKWPVEVPSKPRFPMHTNVVGDAAGSFSTTWDEKAPGDSYESGQAQLEMALNGEPVKFARLGVSAGPGERNFGEPQGKARPPAVVFTGQRESDGKKLTLAIVTSRDLFRPDSSAAVPVQGMLLQGSGFFAMAGFRFVSGTATFEKAAMEPDAPVEGRLEVKILQMHLR